MMGASIPVASGRPELQEGMAIALDLLRMLADPKAAKAAKAALQKIADAQAALDEREQAFAQLVEQRTAELDKREEALATKFADRERALKAREARILAILHA